MTRKDFRSLIAPEETVKKLEKWAAKHGAISNSQALTIILNNLESVDKLKQQIDLLNNLALTLAGKIPDAEPKANPKQSHGEAEKQRESEAIK